MTCSSSVIEPCEISPVADNLDGPTKQAASIFFLVRSRRRANVADVANLESIHIININRPLPPENLKKISNPVCPAPPVPGASSVFCPNVKPTSDSSRTLRLSVVGPAVSLPRVAAAACKSRWARVEAPSGELPAVPQPKNSQMLCPGFSRATHSLPPFGGLLKRGVAQLRMLCSLPLTRFAWPPALAASRAQLPGHTRKWARLCRRRGNVVSTRRSSTARWRQSQLSSCCRPPRAARTRSSFSQRCRRRGSGSQRRLSFLAPEMK